MLAVVFTYFYYYVRTKRADALLRPALLSVASVFYVLVKSGIIRRTAHSTAYGLLALMHATILNANLMFILFGLLLVAITLRKRLFHFWVVTSLYCIAMVFRFSSLRVIGWIPETVQCFFLIQVLLYHFYRDPSKECYVAAFLVVLFGAGRALLDGPSWAYGVVGAESILFILLGVVDRRKGYYLYGGVQGALFIGRLGRNVPGMIHPAFWIIFAGLGFFALGVIVSFQKNRLLAMIGRERSPLHDADKS